MRKGKKIFKNEAGQSMVELAVSFIVLMILLAGVVDVGRMAFYYLSMRDAAQEGASYATIFPNNNFEIIERIKAGVVDQSRIQVIVEFSKKNTPNTAYYKCYYNVPDDEILDGFKDNNCPTYLDNRGAFVGDIEVEDIITITVIDPAFPLTMPFIGTFVGSNQINLETVIKDIILSVPEE
jgi:hypothetical protein